jgi:acyl-CoA thioesterase
MSDAMDAIRKGFAKDQFIAYLGGELLDLRPGFARARLKIEKHHLNSLGIIQGGVIFSLADFAFAVASNAAGRVAVGLNMNLSCLKATSEGILTAEATEISRSRRVSSCTVHVTNEAGELVGVFQGTAFIKEDAYPPK